MDINIIEKRENNNYLIFLIVNINKLKTQICIVNHKSNVT